MSSEPINRQSSNGVMASNTDRIVREGRQALGVGPEATSQAISQAAHAEIERVLSGRLAKQTDPRTGEALPSVISNDGFTKSRFTHKFVKDGAEREVVLSATINRGGVSASAFGERRNEEQVAAALAFDVATAGLKERKAIEAVEARLNATNGFDPRTGEPVQLLTGRARDAAVNELANLRQAYALVARHAAFSHALQVEAKHARDTALIQDSAAADQMAEDMVRGQRVEEMAKQRVKRLQRQLGAG